MPVIPSAFRGGPFYLFNGHLQTILPSLLRRVRHLPYTRERITLPDGDFLDLDWSVTGGPALAIISHGLEGSADRPYIRGMVRALNAAGVDGLAWNYRSCSGESNKLLRSYHMGVTEDLRQVIAHVLATRSYATIYLVGFSAGGNVTLKYLGEDPAGIPEQIKRAAVFSVPCDLKSCAETLSQPRNRIYLSRFLKSLRRKMAAKSLDFPEDLDLAGIELIRSFPEFDDRFTAPIHGFRDAEDYYRQCSSKQFLSAIRLPTLVVNAQNDPFLSPACFPVAEAQDNPFLFLEMPSQGGHVGFTDSFWFNRFYSETRAVDFLLYPEPKKVASPSTLSKAASRFKV